MVVGTKSCQREMQVLRIIVTVCLLARFTWVAASDCYREFHLHGITKSYENCSDLIVQGASIAWSYRRDSNVLAVAFSGYNERPAGWVGWGVNPTCPKMVGSRVLIAFRTSQGQSVRPYKLNRDLLLRRSLKPSDSEGDFRDISSQISDLKFTIFTTLPLNVNQTRIHLVWNRGPHVRNLSPWPHFLDGPSLRSLAVLDINQGAVNIGDLGCSEVVSHRPQKVKHGFIAGIAWGILYPVGTVVGWYTICYPATFLYVYVPFHFVSFAVGMAGFYSGSMLANLDGAEYERQHHLLAVAIVVLATFQLLLFTLRTASPTGYGGDFVTHIKAWFCTYNFILAFVNFFLIAAEIYGGMRLLSPDSEWDFRWLLVSCFAFGLYICNCAGRQCPRLLGVGQP